MTTIDAIELKRMISSQPQPTVINTLPRENFAETRIPRSINIPQDQSDFVQRVEIAAGDREEPVVLYCANRQCDSSAEAAHKLEDAGFTHVYDFEAGAQGWRDAGEKLDTDAPGDAWAMPMGIPDDVIIEPEKGVIVNVRCRRCQAHIGRLQTTPIERDADQEEIDAEIRLLADEHRENCPVRS